MWNEPTKEQLASLPRLYETEHIPVRDKLICLHFFIGGCDWYIAEYDGEDFFFGYAILNNDDEMAEWGYVSLAELKSIKIGPGIEVDNDLCWKIRKASEIPRIKV
jgi:hypothetical protein